MVPEQLPNPLIELSDLWRAEAETLRRYGHATTAKACERHADGLEQAWREWQLEELSIGDAAEESGYSASRLYNMLESGGLPNAGRQGAPRIQRRDLPRRPRSPAAEAARQTLLQRVGLEAGE